jgi:hypothetical protein
MERTVVRPDKRTKVSEKGNATFMYSINNIFIPGLYTVRLKYAISFRYNLATLTKAKVKASGQRRGLLLPLHILVM